MPTTDTAGLYVVGEDGPRLTPHGAAYLADIALDCIRREFPNKLNQTLESEEFLQTPRVLHPAFFGCYDWHSAVHTHWMLARLLRVFPDLAGDGRIGAALSHSISAENIASEVIYFDHESDSWERSYGWAWLLQLAAELETWPGQFGNMLADSLKPLALLIRDKFVLFLPRQDYPIRGGAHANTAFALSLASDYARSVGDDELDKLVVSRALAYYGADRDAPLSWEPGGDDFLSPCLEEAALMARVLDPGEFGAWFGRFLPQLAVGGDLEPARVSDRSDARIVHLDGLNLSRAWNLHRIAARLGDSLTQARLRDCARRHLDASLPYVNDRHYVGAHWLGTFAVYALTSPVTT